ncbi:hypothetical protein CKO15_13020 [Halorhodospira abdelmalekii]|uniref:Lcl C-terminal domain-containing protein n=1 Tax=Halorhodospira abdelmalekii TaxID=421629 RepID=UPI001902E82D|nr:DUF1566 domain-containing protein [Halorhodospira abdelmalekii]MBK1736177.1 hypothetical protein [Halorhodospira abdelmalekii]
MRILPTYLCALVLLAGVPFMVPVAVADIPSASDDCEADLVESTPSSEFTPLEGGAVVRHERTGLEWRRCPEGMEWSGGECSRWALTRTWHGALEYANEEDGWRLPDINELRSIVERCRHSPTINQQVFPGTPSSTFWSASPSARHSGLARAVDFNNGLDGWELKSSSLRVRLVRGGQ